MRRLQQDESLGSWRDEMLQENRALQRGLRVMSNV